MKQDVPTQTQVQEWLQEQLADYLDINAKDVETGVTFQRYGLDSATSLTIIGELSEWLGIEVDATLPYDYPTIAKLSHYIACEVISPTFEP